MMRVLEMKRRRRSDNVVEASIGLLDDAVWRPHLKGYSVELVDSIRHALLKKVPGITEKFNKHTRYFGYRVGTQEDRAYIYIQKKKLVIDCALMTKFMHESFRKAIQGTEFVVTMRKNYQGRAGWLTGWDVPMSSTRLDFITEWICKVFVKSEN